MVIISIQPFPSCDFKATEIPFDTNASSQTCMLSDKFHRVRTLSLSLASLRLEGYRPSGIDSALSHDFVLNAGCVFIFFGAYGCSRALTSISMTFRESAVLLLISYVLSCS